ncbi:MAG: hypothetical protein ABI851_15765 [Saprospiraceae bacterium]
MSRQEFNLDIISKQYRRKGAAAKAFKSLSTLISSNDTRNLKNILRDHKEEPIWENYLVDARDNIDFLIDYYSILETGIIANYFPNNLPSSLKSEIENILGNEYVRKYYSKFYPLILPQLLLRQRTEPISRTDDSSTQAKNILFEKFLVLNQTIKTDSDVDQFLWFLDDGITEGYSINDLWNVLSSRETIQYKLGSSNTHPLNSALFGFIKYVQFLHDYADLLRQSSEFKFLQSAFWHYQSYWFDHMKEQLGDIIKVALKNIKKTMNDATQTEVINDNNSYINNLEDFDKWKSSTDQFEGIEEDIKYLLNQSLGVQLKQLLNENE